MQDTERVFTDEQVIDKVRKLLALATSSNEFEAASAAAKAQELLLKYNIETRRLETEDATDSGIIVRRMTEHDFSGWRSHLVGAVCEATQTRVLFTKLGGKSKLYQIFGKPANCEVAEYLYGYLCKELVRLSPRPIATAESHAFRMGAVATIYTRLLETFTEFKEASADSMALVVTTAAAVDAKVAEMYPKLGKSRAARISDWDAYDRGRVAGKNIPLRRGVGSGGTGGTPAVGGA
jgi:hypothetical protein